MPLWQQANHASHVRCPVCGQSFLIYAESGVSAVDTMNRRAIEHALRAHHASPSTSPGAHPGTTFLIPNRSGAQPFTASAALGELLDSAL